MEVKIEITEGCMYYSYTINGIEYRIDNINMEHEGINDIEVSYV